MRIHLIHMKLSYRHCAALKIMFINCLPAVSVSVVSDINIQNNVFRRLALQMCHKVSQKCIFLNVINFTKT